MEVRSSFAASKIIWPASRSFTKKSACLLVTVLVLLVFSEKLCQGCSKELAEVLVSSLPDELLCSLFFYI